MTEETPEQKQPETYTNHICRICYHMQDTCCADSPRVPFSISDIDRITSLGHRLEDFAIPGEYAEEDFRGEEPWWEASMVKINGKFYKLNVRTKGNACHFLDPDKGCTLGKNRPDVCKIYPFWIYQEDEVTYEDREEVTCFIQNRGSSVSYAMTSIGETADSIRKYFNNIRKDCIENNEQHRGLLLRLMGKDTSK